MTRPIILFALVFFACAVQAQVTLPYFTDFTDADGFELGSLHGQEGWVVEAGSATIVESGFDRFVEIAGTSPAGEIRKSFASTSGPNVTFVEMRLKPVATPVLDDSTLVDLGEVRFRFTRDGAVGRVSAWDGVSETWISTGAVFPVDVNGKAEDFWSLAVRIDYDYGIFDFYFQDELYEIELGHAEPATYFSGFGIFGHMTEATLFGDPFAAFSNPMFDDEALDGIDDAWKAKHDLLLYQNVRYTDDDHDGLTAIEEFLLGKLPRVVDYDPTGLTGFYYVNSEVGSDGYDGKAALVVRDHGPKETISAAMIAAQSGDVVIVLPGLAPYEEDILNPQGKSLTIQPVGQVVLR